MYDLKHELISLRMQIEEAQKNEQEALDEKNLLEGKVKELEKPVCLLSFRITIYVSTPIIIEKC